jgi:hypothetical protein
MAFLALSVIGFLKAMPFLGTRANWTIDRTGSDAAVVFINFRAAIRSFQRS